MTTDANNIVGKVHDTKFRMPVILDDYDERLWLNKELAHYELLTLCKPYSDAKMDVYRVGADVNSTVIKGVINNKPKLMLPLNSQWVLAPEGELANYMLKYIIVKKFMVQERYLVELMADRLVSRFVDGYAKTFGRVTFDMQSGGYNLM